MYKNLLLAFTAIFIYGPVLSQCIEDETDPVYSTEANYVCMEEEGSIRYIYSNFYPDHGYNPKQGKSVPSDPVPEYSVYTMCLYPEESTEFTPLYEETETAAGCTFNYEFGVAINGIKFDPSSAVVFTTDSDNNGSWDNENNINWHLEATSPVNSVGEGMGTLNGGHMNPFGEYHYHNIPLDYFTNTLGIDGTEHSPLVGYAADGFPIYYKYVYSDATDDKSSITAAGSGFTLRAGVRKNDDGITDSDSTLAPGGAYDGNWYEDYEYSSAATILDQCNGRYGVTPEYPYGTYYYVLTDEYPYIPRCFKGSVTDNTFRVGPEASCNSNANATQDDCSAAVSGCMDPFSTNYNPDANVDDGSCVYAAVTWDGSNWSNTDGPGDEVTAVLAANYNFSTDGKFEVGNLTVNSGVTLTVDTDQALIINGDLVNNGTVVVESGGSLLTFSGNNITGNVIYRRNTRYADGKYSFVGSPVLQNVATTAADLGSTVYRYDETEGYANAGLNRWKTVEQSAALTPGVGYAQAFREEITFTGVPNSGDITVTGTFTDRTNSNVEGWVLVANPYPAAIDLGRFLAGNPNITGAVYLWDDNNSASARGSNADYITVNSIAVVENSQAGNSARYNNHLGATQGFFVQLTDNSDPDINFTESMRVSDKNADGNFFRQESNRVPLLNLSLTDNQGSFRSTVIGLSPDASAENAVSKYDAPLINPERDFTLYTLKGKQKYAIQARNFQPDQVALGTDIPEDGNYTLQLSAEGIAGNVTVMDNETGTVLRPGDGSYTFYSKKGSFPGRFTILLNQETITDLPEQVAQTVSYTLDRNILDAHIPDNRNLSVLIYSLSGRLMLDGCLSQGKTLDLNGLEQGIYLLYDGQRAQRLLIE